MLHGDHIVPLQLYDSLVQVLEEKVSDICHTRPVVRKHQRSGDVKNDPGRVLEKHLQVNI